MFQHVDERAWPASGPGASAASGPEYLSKEALNKMSPSSLVSFGELGVHPVQSDVSSAGCGTDQPDLQQRGFLATLEMLVQGVIFSQLMLVAIGSSHSGG
jgi:hypothetical protein